MKKKKDLMVNIPYGPIKNFTWVIQILRTAVEFYADQGNWATKNCGHTFIDVGKVGNLSQDPWTMAQSALRLCRYVTTPTPPKPKK